MIHLLWCTIRTIDFPKFHKTWLDNSKNKDFKTHVLVSTETEKLFLETYFLSIKHQFEIIVFKPKYTGVCLPSYKLSSTLNYVNDDIIVFGSDDFTPPKEWDVYLKSKLTNKNGVLFVRDGYQLPDSSNMLYPAITIPILTGKALRDMNSIIYHPCYSHMFSDCELYLTSKDLGLLIDDRLSDSTEFTHHHYAAGKRNADKYDQSYNQNWQKDESTWKQRKDMPVEKRILVSI